MHIIGNIYTSAEAYLLVFCTLVSRCDICAVWKYLVRCGLQLSHKKGIRPANFDFAALDVRLEEKHCSV